LSRGTEEETVAEKVAGWKDAEAGVYPEPELLDAGDMMAALVAEGGDGGETARRRSESYTYHSGP
jgi:hypothetical protein